MLFRSDGADALAALVLEYARRADGAMPRNVIDLYSGVGVFAGTLAAAGTMAIAVEGDRWAAADARVNLRNLEARVEEHDVHTWASEPAEVVVADPSRNGLGSRGVAVSVGCAPERIIAVRSALVFWPTFERYRELVITNLGRVAHPAIRYRTGDIVVRRLENPASVAVRTRLSAIRATFRRSVSPPVNHPHGWGTC